MPGYKITTSYGEALVHGNFHKYISKWKSKAGGWVYQYEKPRTKSEALKTEAQTQQNAHLAYVKTLQTGGSAKSVKAYNKAMEYQKRAQSDKNAVLREEYDAKYSQEHIDNRRSLNEQKDARDKARLAAANAQKWVGKENAAKADYKKALDKYNSDKSSESLNSAISKADALDKTTKAKELAFGNASKKSVVYDTVKRLYPLKLSTVASEAVETGKSLIDKIFGR